MARKVEKKFVSSEEFQDDVKDFRRLFRILTSEYNQFFAGSRKTLPEITDAALRKIIGKYKSGEALKAGADRFLFFNLLARYNSFREMWGRRLRMMEREADSPEARQKVREEQQRRDMEEELRLQERYHNRQHYKFQAVTADPGKDNHVVETFHKHFKQAHRLAGQDKDGLSLEKFQAFIAKQVEAVKKKKDCRSVKFTMTIENGEVKLKARPVK